MALSICHLGIKCFPSRHWYNTGWTRQDEENMETFVSVPWNNIPSKNANLLFTSGAGSFCASRAATLLADLETSVTVASIFCWSKWPGVCQQCQQSTQTPMLFKQFPNQCGTVIIGCQIEPSRSDLRVRPQMTFQPRTCNLYHRFSSY